MIIKEGINGLKNKQQFNTHIPTKQKIMVLVVTEATMLFSNNAF